MGVGENRRTNKGKKKGAGPQHEQSMRLWGKDNRTKQQEGTGNGHPTQALDALMGEG